MTDILLVREELQGEEESVATGKGRSSDSRKKRPLTDMTKKAASIVTDQKSDSRKKRSLTSFDIDAFVDEYHESRSSFGFPNEEESDIADLIEYWCEREEIENVDRWVDIDASVVEYHRAREEEWEIEDPGDAAHDKYLIKRFYCGSWKDHLNDKRSAPRDYTAKEVFRQFLGDVFPEMIEYPVFQPKATALFDDPKYQDEWAPMLRGYLRLRRKKRYWEFYRSSVLHGHSGYKDCKNTVIYLRPLMASPVDR